MDPDRPPSQPGRRRLLAGLLPGAGLLLGGCSLQGLRNHDGADSPRAAPLGRRPRVAWVLSSGGPRGFVHVGVLKALDRLGLRPDLIVGSSAGALVGTLSAAGLSGAALEARALDLQPGWLMRLHLGGPGWISADGLADWVRETVGGRPLQALPCPMVCVCQRLRDGQVVGLSQGDAGLAVQAATAVVGELAPLRLQGELHGDADPVMPLPVRLARALGAQRVLAVDASAHEDRAPPEAAVFREGDLRKRALIRPDAEAADLLLHPDFGYWVALNRDFRRRAMAAGEAAALAQAPALRALHA